MISTKKVDDFTKTKKYVSFISTRTCPLTCLSCKPGDGRSGLLTCNLEKIIDAFLFVSIKVIWAEKIKKQERDPIPL